MELENGKYAYRNVNGNLSDEYKFADSYSGGFGVVELDDGSYVCIPLSDYFTTTVYLYLIVPIPGRILLCIMVVLSADNSNVEPTNKPIP